MLKYIVVVFYWWGIKGVLYIKYYDVVVRAVRPSRGNKGLNFYQIKQIPYSKNFPLSIFFLKLVIIVDS